MEGTKSGAARAAAPPPTAMSYNHHPEQREGGGRHYDPLGEKGPLRVKFHFPTIAKV